MLAAVASALFSLPLLFLTAQAPSPPTFHAQSPLVVVPVTVSDHRHNAIYGLTEADFELLDEGHPVPFHVDPPGGYRAGISAVIVIQTSGVSGSALMKIRKVGSMVDGYITGEGSEAALITAGAQVRVAQAPTADADAIESAFRELKPGAQTVGRDLDGVAMALGLLARRDPKRRRIILLISETRDRGSKAKLPDILRLAQKENVTIWTISYSAFVTPFTTSAADWQDGGGDKSFNLLGAITEPARLAKSNISDVLAQATGGRHVSFARQSSLENDLASIGKQVHSQYLLTFVPSTKPPAIHSIHITVNGYPDATVRYRPVYWIASP